MIRRYSRMHCLESTRRAWHNTRTTRESPVAQLMRVPRRIAECERFSSLYYFCSRRKKASTRQTKQTALLTERRPRDRLSQRHVVRWLQQRETIDIEEETAARLPSLILIRRCRFLPLMTTFPMTRLRCCSQSPWMTQAEIRAPADCSAWRGASVSMLGHSMLVASLEVDLSPRAPFGPAE